MSTTRYIEEDFVRVYRTRSTKGKPLATLAFGEPVEVVGESDGWTEIGVLTRFAPRIRGFVEGSLPVRDIGVLSLSMVDVQQGDGLILETPGGKVMFIDGGDNKLFARHAAARYRHRATSAESPMEVDAILITHGDADHFDGLNDIVRSETDTAIDREHKRLFIHPKRVLHNGLVKAPSTRDERNVPDRELFGRSVEVDGRLHAVDLYDDPTDAEEASRNRPFTRWVRSLNHWRTRGSIDVRRVAHGMDPADVFDFLISEGIDVEIQGPFTTSVPDPDDPSQEISALPYFHRPKRSALMHLGGAVSKSPSASHTINGHSIALRLTYGNVRFNLTGDLNEESMTEMLNHVDESDLEAEIVKAPHHGSHDFSMRALRAMKPVVAIVSSGDESKRKEHIHPRATLTAALGKSMRGDTGVIFMTEMAAFFTYVRDCYTRESLAAYFAKHKDRTFDGEELRRMFTGRPDEEVDPPGMFQGFERTNFGIVHIRTDGERVLAFTHSGKRGTNEAYRFSVTMEAGERVVEFAPSVTTR